MIYHFYIYIYTYSIYIYILMVWMWHQLRAASDLQHPSQHYEQWLFTVQHSPGYWKRLIRRAVLHSVLQRSKTWQVEQFHARILPRLWKLTTRNPDDLQAGASDSCGSFGCMTCRRSFKNAAGEAAHLFKVHSVPAASRRLFDQPVCGACMKHFHTMQKMKAHLYYSAQCRQVLQSRNIVCHPGPGTGSQEDQLRVADHDGLLPPLQCEGPHPRDCRLRDDPGIAPQLHLALMEIVADGATGNTLEEQILTLPKTFPTSWTLWRRTLLFFADTLDEEDALFFDFDLALFKKILKSLAEPDYWPFLWVGRQQDKLLTLEEYTKECAVIAEEFTKCPPQPSPRAFGRHRHVLHAFSGRRRIGDFQFFLDQITAQHAGYVIHVISMDVINDPILGDAMNEQTKDFWCNAVRQKFVIALLCGPPCESWSCARGKSDPMKTATGYAGPRVIRDVDSLWGFDSLTLKELRQILTIMVELIAVDGFAVLEHPAEPEHDPRAASIWRLAVIKAIVALPNVQRIRFAQGLMGSTSAKPTHLLVVNLPTLLVTLHANRVRTEIPHAKSIGKDDQGRWRTTALKEYAPALCRSLAMEFGKAIFATPVASLCSVPTPAVQAQFLSMVITEYGDTIGADFAPWGTAGCCRIRDFLLGRSDRASVCL